MGEVAAHAPPVVEDLPGGLGGAGVLVTELDVIVHEVADRLHARPAEGSAAEQLPRRLRQAIRLAVAAAEQEHQRLFRKLLHLVLLSRGRWDLELPAVL